MLIGDKHEIFQHRLGDQHPVEWVAVRAGQGARHLPMPKADRQASEALIGNRVVEIGNDGGDTYWLLTSLTLTSCKATCSASP
ncbi:hypothetical protein ABIB06_003219 [Bradyrhizobium sp. LB8.2]|uniref:hypothetical protein n=1 Tax=unclassified Bradyrhizobium TaxID=2631580 RepID=UPI0033933C8A